MWTEVNSWSAFKYQLLVWKLYGMLPPPDGSRWRIPYIIFRAFINMSANFVLTISFIISGCMSKNISELSDTIYVTCACVGYCLKSLNIFMFRKDLLSVESILKKLDSRISSAKESKTIETAIKAVHSFFLLLLKIYFLTIITNVIAVVFGNERTLIFPSWFPWDWKSSLIAWILTNCLLVCITYSTGIQNVGNDTCPQVYLYMATAHIEALKIRVLNLGKAHDIEDDEPEEEKRIYKKLQECIEDHVTILQFMETISQPLSNHCFIQLATTGLQICFMAFNALMMDAGFFSIFLQIFFVFCVSVIAIFILCHCGERFSTACEDLTDAIYDCNWVGQSRRFKKSLLIFLHRSQCSNVLMAGGLVPINYPTFVSVMKTSYSFFTILINMKAKIEIES